MPDNSTVYGVDVEVSSDEITSAISAVSSLESHAQEVEGALASVGATSEVAGEQTATAMAESIRSTEQFSESITDTAVSAERLAGTAPNISSAFKRTFAQASTQGGKLSTSLRAGIGGAVAFVQNRVSQFGSRVSQTASNMASAFRHPADFIRERLTHSFEEVEESAEETGETVEETGEAIESASNAGTSGFERLIGVAKKLAVAFVALKVVQEVGKKVIEFGKQAVEAFKGAEIAAGQLNQVFEDQTAQQWFDDYAKAVNRPMGEVRAFAAQSKGLFDSMDLGEEAAADMAKTMTGLTYDIAAATGASDAETFELMKTAMEGDAKAAGQLGLNFSETALQAEAAAMGFRKQYSELGTAEQAQVRMNAALNQTQKIQGKAIDGQEGLANASKSLNGIWQNFLTTAGERFAPVIEQAMGVIMELWPTVEPMLLQLVDVLTNGLSDAIPVISQLAMDLLPTFIGIIGTLLDVVMPLLPVIAKLANTLLPPLARIFSMLVETVLPPLVDIFTVLVEQILMPLMPIVEIIISALLPPLVSLLELVAPILELIAPVLEVIGKVLGIIAEGLGKVIGWIAEGAGKVVDFFTGLVKGSDDAKTSTEGLGKSVSKIDMSGLSKANDKSMTGMQNSSKTTFKSMEVSAQTANTSIMQQSANSSNAQISDLNQVQNAGANTFHQIDDSASTAWDNAASASDRSTTQMLSNIDKINSASSVMTAPGVAFGNTPQYAGGTDNHPGGLALVGEEGPELVEMPQGTKVYTAGETRGMLNKATDAQTAKNNVIQISNYMEKRERSTGSQAKKTPRNASDSAVVVNMTVNLTVNGDADEQKLEELQKLLKEAAQMGAAQALEQVEQIADEAAKRNIDEALKSRDEDDYFDRQLEL